MEASVSNSLIVLFDLDGVIVENARFEELVTECLIQTLAQFRRFSIDQARKAWDETLEKNRTNPRWHDYSLHCESLNLGDAWIAAHKSSGESLCRFEAIQETLALCKQATATWITSDASRWVVEYKLNAVEISPSTFNEIFTVDRCGANKSDPHYWRQVRDCAAGANVVYIENRIDKIHAALKIMPECVGIWVNEAEHGKVYEFGPIDDVKVENALIYESNHLTLPETLQKLVSNLRR
jgi:beta-phosphoglucomutase-like phosphatase (HAD superfamily)